MTRRTLLALAAIWIGSIISSSAGPALNVSGKWMFVSGWSLAMSGGKPVMTDIAAPAWPLGPVGTITQDDRLFTITPAATGAEMTSCELPRPASAPVGVSARKCLAKMSADSIWLMGLQRVDGAMKVSTLELSLDEEGRLVVAASGPAELGHPGPIAKLIYRRSAVAEQ